MNLNEALELVKSLESKATKKSEIKIYKNFVRVLSKLKERSLTQDELKLIDDELDALQLHSTQKNSKAYFRKRYAQFTKFLRDQFSFVTEGYYAAVGISLGLSLGAGIGLTFGTALGDSTWTGIGLSIGTSIGMVLGLTYGTKKDAEAKEKGMVL